MTAEQLFHVAPHQLLHPYSLFSLMLLPSIQRRNTDMPPLPTHDHFCMPGVKILTLSSVPFTTTLGNYVRAFVAHVPLEEKPFY